MKGYVNIPRSAKYKVCRHCGASAIVVLVGKDGYVVRCPNDEQHYKTRPGLIDIEDWNMHNTDLYDNDSNMNVQAEG
jgi:hypothetical protein